MLTDEEKVCARELLKIIPTQDLYSLVQTVTNRMVYPSNTEECIQSILLHSESLESLLSRKKVSREILFQFLHNNSIPINSNLQKQYFADAVLSYWKKQISNSCLRETFHASRNISVKKENDQICSTVPCNEMALQFVQWFYKILNSFPEEVDGTKVTKDHFWMDCKTQLTMISGVNSEIMEEAYDSENSVKLLCETKVQHRLYFNPNCSTNGTQGKINPHGLVLVLCCGTLHQDAKCVGVFEQLFGLNRDPSSENNWKIKQTQIVLKSKQLVTNMPTLSDGDLTTQFMISSHVEERKQIKN